MLASRSIHNLMKYHLSFMSMTALYILPQMVCLVLEAMIFFIVSGILLNGVLPKILEVSSMIMKTNSRFSSLLRAKRDITHMRKPYPQGCHEVKFSRLKFRQNIKLNSEATM